MSGADMEAIQCCLRVTEAMVDAAMAEEWDTVTALDAQRRPYVERMAASDGAGASAPGVLEALRALVAVDARLGVLAAQERQARLTAVRGVRSGARATASYHQLAAGPC